MSSRQGLLALPRKLDSVTKPQKAAKPLETANSCVSRGSVTQMGLLSLSSRDC